MKTKTVIRWAIGIWAVAFFVQPFVRAETTHVKWATTLWWVAAVLGVLWLWIASLNAWVFWRWFVRREAHRSTVPVGAVLAWLIASVIPSCPGCVVQCGADRFLVFVIMGVLDMGAIPSLVIALARWIRSSGEATG